VLRADERCSKRRKRKRMVLEGKVESLVFEGDKKRVVELERVLLLLLLLVEEQPGPNSSSLVEER